MEKKGENERGKERGKRKGKMKGENERVKRKGKTKGENERGKRKGETKGENERGKRKGKGKTKGDGFPKEYFKIRSGGLPKNGKPKDSFGRASEERKPKDSRSDGLPCSEEWENSKIRSGGLPCSEKRENSKDLIWWASEERKTKKPRFVSKIWRASEERKTKKLRFVRAGFCVEKPRFDRVEWASDLWEKKNQDSIGWASDLWEKRNQDSIGWSGLPTFGKRRTKIRKSRVSQVSSEERKKPKIRKFGWIAKEQSKIRIYEYMNHVIVELYLN
ncbi:hypothetical protein RhiirB3_532983 [Rhizophagus irregularis]|nr:hypothetical protein RhiirB3_532983 [Rhizophagus irregularis]